MKEFCIFVKDLEIEKDSKVINDTLNNIYGARFIENIDYGPYTNYGKSITGKKIAINSKHFISFAKEFFDNDSIIWNHDELKNFDHDYWNFFLLNKYKKIIYFYKLVDIEKYQKIFSKLSNVAKLENVHVWKYFLKQRKLYSVEDIVKYQKQISEHTILKKYLSEFADFKLKNLLSNSFLIDRESFSKNKSAVKLFYEIYPNYTFINLTEFSKNLFFTKDFLLNFQYKYLEKLNLYQEFDWKTAIQNSTYNWNESTIKSFSPILEFNPEIWGNVLSKIKNKDVYYKYFKNVKYENITESLNQNFIWDIKLFQALLDKLDSRENIESVNYKLLEIILPKILLSKKVVKKYKELLNVCNVYIWYKYSWSEGREEREKYHNLFDLIKVHEKLDKKYITSFKTYPTKFIIQD